MMASMPVEIDRVGIADVALDDGQVRMRLEEIAEPHDVEGDDLVAGLQQLGHEDASLVAARAGHENLHGHAVSSNLPRPVRPNRVPGKTAISSGDQPPVSNPPWRGLCLNSECARRKLSGLPMSR